MNKPGRTAGVAPIIQIGCAGWSIPSQEASLFPSGESLLERYARVYSCVEINSSFYRPHQPKTYARWAGSVPHTFRFSVKLPRTITHQLRLRQCEAPLRAFLQQVAALGDKLGCILVQLPPSLALEAEHAKGFFSLLRKCTSVPVACEPRHASWFTPRGARVLRQAGIACVRAHPSPVAGAEPLGDRAMLYIRLHGAPDVYYSSYDDAFIEAVAERIRDAQEEKRDVWCIFDNTARGAAVPNAMKLMHQLAFGGRRKLEQGAFHDWRNRYFKTGPA